MRIRMRMRMIMRTGTRMQTSEDVVSYFGPIGITFFFFFFFKPTNRVFLSLSFRRVVSLPSRSVLRCRLQAGHGRGTMQVTGLVFFFLVVIFLVVISPGSGPLLPGGDVKILRHDLVPTINVT